jgi:hypothetical protein
MSEGVDSTKNIDESWKDAVEKEKHEEALKTEHDHPAPEVSFSNFITSLGLQVLVFLGEVESPLTGQKEENVQQAKFIIDTLDMLKEKTVNNLADDESNLLDNLLYELKMKYVAKTGVR